MPVDVAKYKNIIFDLGGVLINIDYSILIKSFSALGLSRFEEFFSQAKQKDIFDLYEKGLISSDELREKLIGHCRPGTTAAEIDHAWNSMLLDLPKERIDLLHRFSKSHNTFLLSNTNDIHMQSIYNYLQAAYGMKDLSGCFKKVYLSFEVNMRKPDAEIFEHVMQENGLVPEETLFIDDSVQHIEGAGKLGIQTYLLDVKKESILEVLPLI